MPSTEIVIVTRTGQRLSGSIRTIEDGPFRGILLVRPPRSLAQVFDPAGLDHPLLRADRWQDLADRGHLYVTDELGQVEHREAMARWWRQAAQGAATPTCRGPDLTPAHAVIE